MHYHSRSHRNPKFETTSMSFLFNSEKSKQKRRNSRFRWTDIRCTTGNNMMALFFLLVLVSIGSDTYIRRMCSAFTIRPAQPRHSSMFHCKQHTHNSLKYVHTMHTMRIQQKNHPYIIRRDSQHFEIAKPKTKTR